MTKPDKKLRSYLNPLTLFEKNDTDDKSAARHTSTTTQVHNGVTWIDIENPTKKELSKVAETYSLHELHLNESLLRGQLPQLEKENDYLFLQINVPSYDTQDNKIITNQLGFFLGKDFLVTIHEDTVAGIRELFNACEQDEALRSNYFQKTSGYLLYSILSDHIKSLYTMVRPILEQIEEIEDNVFDGETSDAYPISQLRHKIMRMRRVTGGLKSVLEDLTPHVGSFTNNTLKHHFASNLTAVNKLRETIDDASETVEIYKDADFTASTEKTNEILAILTLIFTFTIPPTVLGTFFGMNIPLPGGVETGAWNFLGTYTTLILIFILSLSQVLLMYWYFKRKKWF